MNTIIIGGVCMEIRTMEHEQISAFGQWLAAEERSPGTVEKYLRDVRAFAAWLDGNAVTKETVSEWKEYLISRRYCPVTINSMLAAVHAFF